MEALSVLNFLFALLFFSIMLLRYEYIANVPGTIASIVYVLAIFAVSIFSVNLLVSTALAGCLLGFIAINRILINNY